MFYRKRRKYKYSLVKDETYETGFKLDGLKNLGLLRLTKTGKLTIKNSYAWDGASGPAIDTRNFMRGSLIHDALYQFIREGILNNSDRKRCDEILRDICLEDGMSKIRAWWVYRGVRTGGAFAAKPDFLIAP
jgi:hypothetical protein